ncbi:MAG: winged helix-turn-helix domain-containing protein [Longimicrobiales bacterium]
MSSLVLKSTTRHKSTSRSKHELYYLILKCIASNRDTRITHIMYTSQIPHFLTKKKLKNLLELYMIEYNVDTKKYKITENGSEYIRVYETLQKID